MAFQNEWHVIGRAAKSKYTSVGILVIIRNKKSFEMLKTQQSRYNIISPSVQLKGFSLQVPLSPRHVVVTGRT